MTICSNCGHGNSERAKFCEECGAALETAPPSREQRKTVTILFCDLTGSTELGESTDAEAVRALLARYFDRMKGIVETHGGTVEKFIGDAVMAVFGVPQVHEDDALRACRAALEMRNALPELGLEARIGLNTGEVVTGTAERLATGDAVNVAARLEQRADPGEILVGADTLALVADAVASEPLSAIELKGKSQPVQAHRLLSIDAARKRLHDTPFVARGMELELLREAWERVVADKRCELVTVVGEAGIGKSRLVSEFLGPIDARVVAGRCLPYGNGITYWPAIEVVKQLDARPSDPGASAAIGALLGETEEQTTAPEIAWAFRKLLEEQAQEGPLVVVLDDIHSGEETFLDLIEHVALLSSGASILLLCMARPELLDRRATWPVLLRLELLDEADVGRLIPERLPAPLRERIAHAAGGNPLFIAEMLAMSDGANGELDVPPTLRGLLVARLDQLDDPERRVLECAAVEGEVFHRGAVQALVPEDAQATARLAALVRRELVRPDRSHIPGDDGFRFRHLLIRDAAYGTLSKSDRAKLHERFADWLRDRGQDVVEREELLGHHLEQAFGYRAELGQPGGDLAVRAGRHLATAGRRAAWRDNLRSAASLLERSLELTRELEFDLGLELELVLALRSVEPRKAAEVADDAAAKAAAAGDEPGAALARVSASMARTIYAGDESLLALEATARAALPLLEQAGDHAGLAKTWEALAMSAEDRIHREEAALGSERALRESRLAGEHRNHLFGLERALAFGPRPADEALRTLDQVAPENPPPAIQLHRALLLGMLGRFDEAWQIGRDANERFREQVGHGFEYILAFIAIFEDDNEAAAGYLRRQCDDLEALGRLPNFAFHAIQLGRCLCALGRQDEAEALVQRAEGLGLGEDAWAEIMWRQTLALVRASQGRFQEAHQLALEAVTLAEATDDLGSQGDASSDLGEVLQRAGRTDEAVAALEQALERYERKKNLAMVAQVRPKLDELREEMPS